MMEENPRDAKIIVNKCRHRLKQEKPQEKQEILQEETMFLKVHHCRENYPIVPKRSRLCEIYIVEGDSAGGTAKMRGSKIPSHIAFVGKMLNVEKSGLIKLFTTISFHR